MPAESTSRTRSIAVFLPPLLLAVLAGSWALCAFGSDGLLSIWAAELPPLVFAALALLAVLAAAVSRSWFAGGAALGAVAIAAMPLGGWNLPSRASQPAPYRVLTCNVEQWSHDGAVVGRVFSELAPDVFCLQEAVSYDDIPGDPEWSAFRGALSGYQLLRHGEIAIGTRWPVLAEQLVPLPEGPDTRPLLDVTLQSPAGTPLHVISAHLVYTHYYGKLPGSLSRAARARRAQAQRLLEHVAHLNGPVLVCGDFNATSNSGALSLLRQQLADAWQLRGHGFGFTFSSDWPWRRIDYLLLRAVDVSEVHVVEQPLSDHRALSASFRVAGE
jgi:vancomycin resistance protein VanJ